MAPKAYRDTGVEATRPQPLVHLFLDTVNPDMVEGMRHPLPHLPKHTGILELDRWSLDMRPGTPIPDPGMAGDSNPYRCLMQSR